MNESNQFLIIVNFRQSYVWVVTATQANWVSLHNFTFILKLIPPMLIYRSMIALRCFLFFYTLLNHNHNYFARHLICLLLQSFKLPILTRFGLSKLSSGPNLTFHNLEFAESFRSTGHCVIMICVIEFEFYSETFSSETSKLQSLHFWFLLSERISTIANEWMSCLV